MRFSANLGFLWTDRPLPEAIHAAKAAGFDAVECHWPYDTPPEAMRAALDATGLPMLGLNTRRGDVSAGEMGLSALPGREADARNAIDEALNYARAVGAESVHVMAGIAEGSVASDCFITNLVYAAAQAEPQGITLLIEPLNRHDAPGYFLETTDQAQDIIDAVNSPALKLMFDCYHVGRTEGDVTTRLAALQGIIGHIQFAAVPSRGAPDTGELEYRHVFRQIADLGWDRPLGAEYRPNGATEDSMGWMTTLRPARL